MKARDLKIGDSIVLIDQDIKGEIIKIKGPLITIISQFGLELEYPIEKIVKIEKIEKKYLEESHQKYDLMESIAVDVDKSKSSFFKKKSKNTLEIDLHIEKLFVRQYYKKTSYEILLQQLEIAKETLELLYDKNTPYRRAILIHGNGKGILKEELKNLIKSNYPQLEYLDASYLEYGSGATEVRFKN